MTSTLPLASWDPMAQFGADQRSVRDPHPDLARHRREEPIKARTAWGTGGKAVAAYELYRYDDCAAVLRDQETFSSSSIRDNMQLVMGPYPLVGMDEPDHKRLRSLVAQAFRQKTLAHLEDDLVVPVVDDMIDGFVDRGEAELVREMTYRYPVQVIAVILGLPKEDYEQFHAWASAIISFGGKPMEGIRASNELRSYLEGVLADRRAHPRDDLISELASAEIDGEQLGDEELYSFVRLLLPAGAETTYRATGNLLFGLLSDPPQLDAVRADRTQLTAAVEEAIRWEPPLLITSRVATQDAEVAGTPVAAGTQIIPNIGSANRDETRWDDAEAFDLFREAKPVISFGVGPHMCLGMHLARMEMRAAVNRLLDRCPNLRFDAERVAQDDAHIHGETFRSPTTLPVRFDAAA
ncbi:MAG TPA: cytochrome P450 [Acidimicrobiia bacterium]|nr:cytochrome P450 [Acidimicrobiia bacterium]